MRDILLTAFIVGLLPVALFRPWVGILLWTWVGLMNPHKLTWGFAFNLQFALMIGLVTIAAVVLSKEPKRIPWAPPVVALVAFVLWMTLTTIFAINPDGAWPQWEKVVKVQLMVILTLMVMRTKRYIQWLTWVTAGSIAFYGVKGGLFTLRGGSSTGTVLGPPGGFIEGNTAIALAITMVLPLIVYGWTRTSRRWIRWALAVSIALCAVAVIGSYSRGGLLAILAMGAFLWLKSRKKLFVTIALICLIPLVFAVMPQKWFDRMDTINTYEEDTSAMGRINAWWFAFNLVKDRPITGGGFEAFTEEAFLRWAPNPLDHHDAHSIYFEVLGEQGFVGLFLFLLMWWLTWRVAGDIIRRSRDHPQLRWAGDLAAMIQVSLIGYLAGGAFLGLAYFDLPYIMIAILVLTQSVVRRELTPEKSLARSDKTASAPLISPSGHSQTGSAKL